MAIGRRRSGPGPAAVVNPLLGEIEVAWDQVRSALAGYDGAEAARLLGELFSSREREPVGNACWSRANAWLVSWFRARGLGRSEQFPGEDFSQDALISWLRSIYTDGREQPELLRPVDLAFVVQELREYDRKLEHERRPA